MAWLVVNKYGSEYITDWKPFRDKKKIMVPDGEEEDYQGHFFSPAYKHNGQYEDIWDFEDNFRIPKIKLPKGSIKKLIGKELTWEDEPVELKEE